MSYDRVWVCPDLEKNHWVRSPKRSGENQAGFEALLNEAYRRGHRVSLSAGQNILIDELFVFVHKNDAQEFFDRGYLEFECLDSQDQGVGFDRVVLVLDWIQVAAKGPLPGTLRASSEEPMEGVEDAELE